LHTDILVAGLGSRILYNSFLSLCGNQLGHLKSPTMLYLPIHFHQVWDSQQLEQIEKHHMTRCLILHHHSMSCWSLWSDHTILPCWLRKYLPSKQISTKDKTRKLIVKNIIKTCVHIYTSIGASQSSRSLAVIRKRCSAHAHLIQIHT
jgi:hypothetical protein